MEEVKREDGEGEPAERSRDPQSRSNWTPGDVWPHCPQRSWALQTPRPLRGWYSLAPLGMVWFLCQAEAPLHASLWPACWRLLSMCLLWTVLGGCAHALRCRLRPGRDQVQLLERNRQEAVTENRNIQDSWASQLRSPDPHGPLSLTLALANSLLLCVLQEPLLDPNVPHIQALLSRLETVSHTLEEADEGPEVTLEKEEEGQDSALTDTVKLIHAYLRRRMRSLRALLQVQGDFEAVAADALRGLGSLWARLEELHTTVTLTKEGGQGHGDLALARAEAENLLAILGHYRGRLQCCQTHLKDATQILQELTWSHTHVSNSVSSSSSSCDSVWPELLLQANIEQFDKVQETFLSLEQQTSTFQAHLDGLRKGNQEGHSSGADSRSASPCVGDVSPGQHRSTCAPASPVDADTDADTETGSPLSLCERSALQFSSTIGRLRKSGRKK